MYRGVELFQALRGIGQFGDAEQRRLQPLAALALQHLLAQHAIGLAQRRRAVGHPPPQFDVRLAPLQRGLHVLGHVVQQLQVMPRVVRVGPVALHHDAAHHAPGAQQRHAQPVLAAGPDQHKAIAELLPQFVDRAHQRPAFLQQVPGQAVQHVVQRQILVRRWRVAVGDVDVVGKADGIGDGVVQHDVEIFRVHQAADDGMQRAHHFGHVVFGAGLFGNRIQRALQPLGQRKARDRLVQAAGFSQLTQPRLGQPTQPCQLIPQRLGGGQLGRFKQQRARALRVLRQHQLPRRGRLAQRPPVQPAMDAQMAQCRFAQLHHAGGVHRFEEPLYRSLQGRALPARDGRFG